MWLPLIIYLAASDVGLTTIMYISTFPISESFVVKKKIATAHYFPQKNVLKTSLLNLFSFITE